MNRQRKDAITLATLVTVTAICLLAAGKARADCVDGTREITAAERNFFERAVAALAASIPATPANMEQRGKPHDFKAPPRLPSFCKGQREGDFEIGVSAAYLFRWPKADAERMSAERKQLLDQIAALEALPPEQAARHRELTEQSRAAYNSQPKAKRGGPPLSDADRRLAEQKVAEGRALEDQAKAIERAHLANVKPQSDALRTKADALQTSPQELQVTFGMNVRQSAAADARAAIASFGNPSPGRSAGLKVHNTIAVVSGPQGAPRQALFDAIDPTRLRSLLGNALPAVAESEALAAARVPASAPPATNAAPNASPSAATPGSSTAAALPAAPTATAPANAPSASKKEAPKKADAGITAQDAANAVNKLKGLFGR